VRVDTVFEYRECRALGRMLSKHERRVVKDALIDVVVPRRGGVVHVFVIRRLFFLVIEKHRHFHQSIFFVPVFSKFGLKQHGRFACSKHFGRDVRMKPSQVSIEYVGRDARKQRFGALHFRVPFARGDGLAHHFVRAYCSIKGNVILSQKGDAHTSLIQKTNMVACQRASADRIVLLFVSDTNTQVFDEIGRQSELDVFDLRRLHTLHVLFSNRRQFAFQGSRVFELVVVVVDVGRSKE
jgi:hypothetical protein